MLSMGDKPGPDREATNRDILSELRDHYSPAMGASEVADRLDVSRQTVDKHLRAMDDDGLVNTRMVGTVRVWWLSDDGKRFLDDAA